MSHRCQEIILSHHAGRQSSGSHQAVIRQSSGSHQAVIRQLSSSHQIAIHKSANDTESLFSLVLYIFHTYNNIRTKDHLSQSHLHCNGICGVHNFTLVVMYLY